MSESQTIKLQIPTDKSLRDAFEARAKRLGFSSAQEYIRVWMKAEVDGRELDFDADSDWGDWGPPPQHVIDRWDKELREHEQDRKAGKVKSYTNADDFLRDLKNDAAR